MKTVRYVHKLKADTRPKLLGYKAPGPVRALALRVLEDRDENDFLLKHALKDAKKYEPRTRLLECWHSDGSWGTDRLYMRSHGEAAARERELVVTVKHLALLHLYGWRDRGEWIEGYLDEAAELILGREQPDGFLQFASPDKSHLTDKGKPSVFRSGHWPGIAIATLLDFGVEDQRIERFLQWLDDNQRPDGGWLPEQPEQKRTADDDAGAPQSHPLYTANFALALSAHPRWKESETARTAVEFLLSAIFSPVGSSPTPPQRSSEERWFRLAEPQWGYDALKVLNIALDTGFGPEHEGVGRIVRWLIESQGSSGLWRSRRKRPGPDEDLFLTMRATAALKRVFDDLSPGDDQQS